MLRSSQFECRTRPCTCVSMVADPAGQIAACQHVWSHLHVDCSLRLAPGWCSIPLVVCVGLCAVQNQTKKEDTLGSASTNAENRINYKNWLFQNLIVMSRCRSSAMNRYVTLYGWPISSLAIGGPLPKGRMSIWLHHLLLHTSLKTLSLLNTVTW